LSVSSVSVTALRSSGKDLSDEFEGRLMVVLRHLFAQRHTPQAALAADDAGKDQRQRAVAPQLYEMPG
jgi:hypothetical protein